MPIPSGQGDQPGAVHGSDKKAVKDLGPRLEPTSEASVWAAFTDFSRHYLITVAK